MLGDLARQSEVTKKSRNNKRVNLRNRGTVAGCELWTAQALRPSIKSWHRFSTKGRGGLEGKNHPDRAAQFRHINEKIARFHQMGAPAVSVDTKKKELIGVYKNAGREYHKKGAPQEVQAHDFPDPKLGKAIPYGVYDVGANQGWVSVGVDHDTAEFATETLRRCWVMMGRRRYPDAKELLIMADGGGSNSSRSRLWKVCLQKLATAIGLKLTVCHFPPATSKWNKIEHRMFSHITQNWRGKPLINHEVVVQLIGATTTGKGLTIQAELDPQHYPLKKKVTQRELEEIQLSRDAFHGEWNYSIDTILQQS